MPYACIIYSHPSPSIMGVKVFYLDYGFADEDFMDELYNDESFSLLPNEG